jgi:predicted RNase H-like nuclease (RuvC/YqgF family)
MSSGRIEELEKEIAELKRRWPAHSVSPTMLQQLDEREEELERELKKATEEQDGAKADGHGGLWEMPT